MSASDDTSLGATRFWDNFLKAVETDPRQAATIRGASRIEHPIVAAGIDEGRRRLIIVSPDIEARHAAMMQADIQSAFKSLKVLVTRPLIADPRKAAGLVFNETRLEEFAKGLGSEILLSAEIFGLISKFSENPIYSLLENEDGAWFAMQCHKLQTQLYPIADIYLHAKKEKEPEARKALLRNAGSLLEVVRTLDPLDEDRKVGLCGIPFYDFSSKDLEPFHSQNDLREIQEVLRHHEVLQYFFPSPDQLALGLIDRESNLDAPQILDHVLSAPALGHPFGVSEIISSPFSITDIVDELKERNLVVEGEIGLEITDNGQYVRSTVRFKPREGIVSKILNRFSINLDLKDIFKG